MRGIPSGKNILNRVIFSIRPICSAVKENKPTTSNGGGSGSGDGSSSSLSQYNEQYKALNNLDFMTATKILFSDPPKKKKFGLDFYLVQLFFICLPSFAVYLVAQYARYEMKKMDAELERKKKAELEAKAKEVELKAAEEKATAESDPRFLEVKERLDKLEEAVKEIATGSKNQSSDPVKEGQGYINEQKGTIRIQSNDIQRGSEGKILKDSGKLSSEEKTTGTAPVNEASASEESKKAP